MMLITEPYLKGILKIAPISNKGAVSLTPENITDLDLIRPLQDIVDICGTNPSSIVFSVNTNSSEESGRTSDLNMHKDILGRVRSMEIEMPPLTKEGYQNLQELLMDLTENIDYSIVLQDTSNLESGKTEAVSGANSTEYQGFTIYAKVRNATTGWVGTVSGTIESNTPGDYQFYLTDYYNVNGEELSDEYDLKALRVTVNGDDISVQTMNGYGYNFVQLSATIEVTPTITNETYSYVVWYLIEFMSPEMNKPIREIVYVGDSSFTNIKPFYKPNIVYDENGCTKTSDEIYVKDVKLNLIAKTAKAKRRF